MGNAPKVPEWSAVKPAGRGLETTGCTINDEANAAYGWAGAEEIQTHSARYEPTWIRTDNKDVSVASGTINLKSYVMTLLNDTRLCKGAVNIRPILKAM